MSTKVGIVLVNYKDYAVKFLSACRDSLRAQDYPATLTKIYIVDNASSASSLNYLRENYPEAILLPRFDGNYTAANNLGFKEAASDSCDYIVTVNMDTEMTPQWLSELVKALDLNPSAGIAQSKILLYPKTEIAKSQPRLNSLGNIIHFLGFGFTSHYGEADREISGYPEIKGYASGCSFIIRRELFEKVGGYNEEFYMYHDDIELSLKVRLAGYQIILAPQSVIYHKYEFSRSIGMLYYMERNRYLLLLCFYPPYLLFLLALPLFIMDCGLIFYALISGWAKTEIKVYLYFFQPSTYTLISVARQRIKQLRVIKFRNLAQDFAGRLEFLEIDNPLLRYGVNPSLDLYWKIIKRFI
ncbi:MAG: glycosyltransferase family 2 protein [Patescibacteria group bacterium]